MPVAKRESAQQLAAKRQSAVYLDKVYRLGSTDPDMPEKEIDRIALEAVDLNVYGHDAKRDRHGRFIPQGIGAPGRETENHFNAIRKYQSREDWEKAVREIYKRDPDHAARLGLPKLPPEKTQ